MCPSRMVVQPSGGGWVCSEKLDVEDHYVAWRQTHDQPQHQFGLDGPFSFCSYPFLLNPRAKSKLLHTEARFLMTQVCPLSLLLSTTGIASRRPPQRPTPRWIGPARGQGRGGGYVLGNMDT